MNAILLNKTTKLKTVNIKGFIPIKSITLGYMSGWAGYYQVEVFLNMDNSEPILRFISAKTRKQLNRKIKHTLKGVYNYDKKTGKLY